MSKLRLIAASVLALPLWPAKDTLVVQDLTDPDRDRALGRPATWKPSSRRHTRRSRTHLGERTTTSRPSCRSWGWRTRRPSPTSRWGRAAQFRHTDREIRAQHGDVGNFRDFTVLQSRGRMAVIGIAGSMC